MRCLCKNALNRPNKRALTYIEIIAVIGLISILMLAATKTYTEAGESAQRSKVIEDLTGLSRSLKYYFMEIPDPNNTFKTFRQSGSANALNTLQASGRLSHAIDLIDPWGEYYTMHKVYNGPKIEFYVGCTSPKMQFADFEHGSWKKIVIDLNDGIPPAQQKEVEGFWIKVDEMRK